MVKKILGFFLAGAGVLILLVSSIPKLWEKIPLPSDVAKMATQTTTLIVSIALILVGIFFLKDTHSKGKNQKVSEVPIYHGENVVGFRRIKTDKL